MSWSRSRVSRVAVQDEFVLGTLLIAATGLAHRVPMRRLFLLGCLVVAVAKGLALLVPSNGALVLGTASGLCYDRSATAVLGRTSAAAVL
jgi:Na+/melibiose symporter-like transporter